MSAPPMTLQRVETDPRLPSLVDEKAMLAFLERLENPRALDLQRRLAKAYDAACDALLGPNDKQIEGKGEKAREFKKKSAWRKLARHFGISTTVLSQTERWITDPTTGEAVFVASCLVRAVAPWGQTTDATGACGTDEEQGFRKITIADAIATAETRAVNRGVSNLIAMGEVSAEEASRDDRATAQKDMLEEMSLEEASAVLYPWNQPEKYRGKTLGEISTGQVAIVLRGTVSEIEKSGERPRRLQVKRACEVILADRNQPPTPERLNEARRLLTLADLADDKKVAVASELDSTPGIGRGRLEEIIKKLEPLVPTDAALAAAMSDGDPESPETPDQSEPSGAVPASLAQAVTAQDAPATTHVNGRLTFAVVAEPFAADHFVLGRGNMTLCDKLITQTWPMARGLFYADTGSNICATCRERALALDAEKSIPE